MSLPGRIAIVLPCFNEAERLSLDSLMLEIDPFPQVDFLFVNDGSTDNTAEILSALMNKKKNVRVLHFSENVGKAEAVRGGFLEVIKKSEYSYIGYFDADFATPLNQLVLFFDHIVADPSHQLLLGSRIKRAGASIRRNHVRHYVGRIVATLVNNSIVKIPVYDTQCGAKVMTAALAKEIFRDPFLSRWLFDIELIARLQEIYDYDRVVQIVYEVPLNEWIEKGKTKIRLKDVVGVPFQLLKIYRKYKVS